MRGQFGDADRPWRARQLAAGSGTVSLRFRSRSSNDAGDGLARMGDCESPPRRWIARGGISWRRRHSAPIGRRRASPPCGAESRGSRAGARRRETLRRRDFRKHDRHRHVWRLWAERAGADCDGLRRQKLGNNRQTDFRRGTRKAHCVASLRSTFRPASLQTRLKLNRGESIAMLKFTEDHEWLRIEGDVATVGITDHAQEQLGDLVFVELPAPGARPEKGAAAAVVESVKAASDVYAPVSGEVIEINQAIVDEPALVNRDPMGKGWFFKIKISDPSQLERLLDEKAYQAMIA